MAVEDRIERLRLGEGMTFFSNVEVALGENPGQLNCIYRIATGKLQSNNDEAVRLTLEDIAHCNDVLDFTDLETARPGITSSIGFLLQMGILHPNSLPLVADTARQILSDGQELKNFFKDLPYLIADESDSSFEEFARTSIAGSFLTAAFETGFDLISAKVYGDDMGRTLWELMDDLQSYPEIDLWQYAQIYLQLRKHVLNVGIQSGNMRRAKYDQTSIGECPFPHDAIKAHVDLIGELQSEYPMFSKLLPDADAIAYVLKMMSKEARSGSDFVSNRSSDSYEQYDYYRQPDLNKRIAIHHRDGGYYGTIITDTEGQNVTQGVTFDTPRAYTLTLRDGTEMISYGLGRCPEFQFGYNGVV
jgi:hypothetical protein